MRQIPERAGIPFAIRWIALASGLAILTACGTNQSGLRTIYYQVPGTTFEEINEQIARHGLQNGHAIGTAQTRMTPRVKTVRENGTCRIGSAEVDLDLVVTLPRFSELNKADPRTRAAFERLRAHVEWHEQQHAEISQSYAKKIETELAQLPPQKTCRQAKNKARAKFRELFEEHNRAQKAFDESERGAIKRRLRALGMIT